ncbi:carbohydrate-binding module family 13 protein [Rhizophagus clarus]|nr:carbohydrate-binding module family 13 protein [Rhizophagus clarus]
MILRYIYGGRLSLEKYDTSDIIKILIASNELCLQELIIQLQLFLIENKKDWIEQNFSLVYKTSFENDSFLELQNFCIELMSKEQEKIFNSIDFTSLSEKCLISLIQHDDFQMDVIQVWEHVLKWGIAQNSGLPSDPSSYSKDDFNSLKNILQHLIPFIKFDNLTSKEYMDEVYPYKKILPKDLRENLLKYFMYQQNSEQMTIIEETKTKSIDSKIITIKHAELISKWVDRLEISDKMKNSYEFKLILRGSRDGFSPNKFHEICDNKTHTITITKVKDSDEILGGYNPIVWNSNYGYNITNDSFIFSFKNKHSIKGYILSRVKNEENAIFNNGASYYGPTFGFGDFFLCGNDCYDVSYCSNIYYKKSIRESSNDFSVDEYEIFQIMKD